MITGNDENVIDYIQCVEGIDVSETLAVVVLNSPSYAGTTYFGYYSENQVTELAIAYCPIIYNLETIASGKYWYTRQWDMDSPS